MNKAEKYWYSFNLDGWFDAAGRKLHISSMEPIVRGCDYDAIAARLSDAENERDVSRQRACGWRDKAEADLLLARQENERLRAALRDISKGAKRYWREGEDAYQFAILADAALKEGT